MAPVLPVLRRSCCITECTIMAMAPESLHTLCLEHTIRSSTLSQSKQHEQHHYCCVRKYWRPPSQIATLEGGCCSTFLFACSACTQSSTETAPLSAWTCGTRPGAWRRLRRRLPPPAPPRPPLRMCVHSCYSVALRSPGLSVVAVICRAFITMENAVSVFSCTSCQPQCTSNVTAVAITSLLCRRQRTALRARSSLRARRRSRTAPNALPRR